MPGQRRYLPILRDRVQAPRFQSLLLFVTSRCKSLCRTCFYFDKLNSTDDLTFDQIRKMSDTAPRFGKLWISGGEPFLRDELAEIVAMFARNNGVTSVNLPTNGLLPDRMFRALDAMLEQATGISIDLNVSLDGLANTHDSIRGVPNNFTRTLETMKACEQRYGGVKRLRRNVLTVITRENYGEIVRLGLHLMENAAIDGQYFEVVRGQTPDASLKNLSRADVAALHRQLLPFHRHYAKKLFAHLPKPARAVATMYYLGNLRLHFELHEKCLERPERWPMPCTAGQTSIVVDHNGRFRACELRGIVGDLADFNYNLSDALASQAMRQETTSIPEANCWCTHSCFIQDSSKFSPRVQLFEIPWAWWKQRSERADWASLAELERFKSLELA